MTDTSTHFYSCLIRFTTWQDNFTGHAQGYTIAIFVRKLSGDSDYFVEVTLGRPIVAVIIVVHVRGWCLACSYMDLVLVSM